MSISVGLLLDAQQVPLWQLSIINFIKTHGHLKVGFIIINNGKKSSGGDGRWFYRVLRKIDRSVFKTKSNQFQPNNLADVLAGIEVRMVFPNQTKFKDKFDSTDLAWIQERQPDILIRFGFRILTGEILSVARYGVWSLHHGDSAVNRGGPPAFWEVVNREAVTGVTLQILSEKLDAGQVLGKAFCKTDTTSFNRNQQSVYAAGVELFCSRMNDFARLGPEKFFQDLPQGNNQFAKTLYRDPDNVKAFQIGFAFWWRRMIELLDGFFFIRQWIIAYHRNAETPFDFNGSKRLIAQGFTDWADPFVFHHKGIDYLFFESLVRREPNGEILCVRLDQPDSVPIQVLKEPYHLSYPTITEHEGKLYLMAESGAAKTVCLYECEEFPRQWKKLKPILEGVELYDPTIHFHEGLWYLFATHRQVAGASADMNLCIYNSKDLTNGWRPHEMNPITHDVRGSRPAGKIFNYQGKLIRPSQIGAPRYGYGIRFMEISKLTPSEYSECPVEEIFPWQRDVLATHTFSSTHGWFVADAQIKRFRFF